jgi:hypothetical protein
MKIMLRLVLVSVLIIVAAPAYSGEATQMWKCELDDDVSEQAVTDMVRDWLKAAKQMEGGERLEAYVFFPVAVSDTGESDMMIVLVAPSFTEWGKFWDGYEGSPAAELDSQNDEMMACPDSALWESFKVEVK